MIICWIILASQMICMGGCSHVDRMEKVLEQIEIGEIIFVPRNDDNFVRRGQDYELFYHDGTGGWKSLGRRIATADTLRYDNIPANSVLWLHNHSGGKEERCFYVADGKQRFI